MSISDFLSLFLMMLLFLFSLFKLNILGWHCVISAEVSLLGSSLPPGALLRVPGVHGVLL